MSIGIYGNQKHKTQKQKGMRPRTKAVPGQKENFSCCQQLHHSKANQQQQQEDWLRNAKIRRNTEHRKKCFP